MLEFLFVSLFKDSKLALNNSLINSHTHIESMLSSQTSTLTKKKLHDSRHQLQIFFSPNNILNSHITEVRIVGHFYFQCTKEKPEWFHMWVRVTQGYCENSVVDRPVWWRLKCFHLRATQFLCQQVCGECACVAECDFFTLLLHAGVSGHSVRGNEGGEILFLHFIKSNGQENFLYFSTCFHSRIFFYICLFAEGFDSLWDMCWCSHL